MGDTCYSESILAFAHSRGLKDARIEHRGLAGLVLCGKGKDKLGYPLVWAVAEECGINRGCGGVDYQQIKPENFICEQTTRTPDHLPQR